MNPAPAHPEPGTAAFDAWCQHLEDELCIPNTAPAERSWLWDLFTHNGSMPPDLVAPLVLQRRHDLTTRALGQLLHAARTDLKTDISLDPHIRHPEPLEPAGQVTVYTDEIQSLDAVGVFQEVAAAVQDFLAYHLNVMWPRCPEHRAGTHPEPTLGGVTWTCTTGPHPVRTMTAPAEMPPLHAPSTPTV